MTSLRTRMVVMIAGTIAAVFSIALVVVYLLQKQDAIVHADVFGQQVAHAHAAEVDSRYREASAITQLMALDFATHPPASADAMSAYLHSVLQRFPKVYTTSVGWEPYAFNPHVKECCPCWYRKKGVETFLPLVDGYRNQDWYKLGRQLSPTAARRDAWTEPYVNLDGTDILVITCVVPFFKEGRPQGVAEIDLDLTDLSKEAQGVVFTPPDYVMVLSHSGKVVTFPDHRRCMQPLASFDAPLAEALRADPQGQHVILQNGPLYQKPARIYHAHMPTSGFDFVLINYDSSIFAVVRSMQTINFLIHVVGLGLLVLLVRRISFSIFDPVRALVGAAQRVAKGGLDEPLPHIEAQNEVGDLATSFAAMIAALKKQMAEVAQTTADKERITADLRVAADIQRSILPRIYPAFPDRAEFDAFGLMLPAKEVGGDFYDHFMVDDTHLAFIVGDVSGKGPPAAIFMAVAATFVRATGLQGVSPRQCLERVNKAIYPENDNMMFVTMFYGLLDTQTGEVVYVNAGHNPPYVQRTDGSVEKVPITGDAAVGPTEITEYHESRLTLAPGETLVVYSDGVTEAFNTSRKMYGVKRLEALLAAERGDDPAILSETILEAVQEHAAGAPQSDDITVLSIRYRGQGASCQKPTTLTLRMKTDEVELQRVLPLLSHFMKEHEVTEAVAGNVKNAVQEMLTNILRYAYTDGSVHYVSARASLVNGSIDVTVEDDGKPFNPVEFADRDSGIGRVRGMMDSLEYARVRDRNRVTLRKKLR